jgi:uncharacterized protein
MLSDFRGVGSGKVKRAIRPMIATPRERLRTAVLEILGPLAYSVTGNLGRPPSGEQRVIVTDNALRRYFTLTFAITWGAGGTALLLSAASREIQFTSRSPLYYFAGYGPSLAGLVLTWRFEGRDGLLRLLARAIPSRAGFPWYLAVIAGYSAVPLFAGWLAGYDTFTALPTWDRLLILLAVSVVADTGPIGEEFGWRGFALPRMLERRTPLTASLILGAIWAFWHIPTFFMPSFPQNHLPFPLFVVSTTAICVIQTWLYLRTGGDLFLMILVHLMTNYCLGFLRVPFTHLAYAEITCAVLIVALGGMRKSIPTQDPTEQYHMPVTAE